MRYSTSIHDCRLRRGDNGYEQERAKGAGDLARTIVHKNFLRFSDCFALRYASGRIFVSMKILSRFCGQSAREEKPCEKQVCLVS